MQEPDKDDCVYQYDINRMKDQINLLQSEVAMLRNELLRLYEELFQQDIDDQE